MLEFDGQKLKLFRGKQKLTQIKFAKKCGSTISNSDIYKYESGLVKHPTPERISIMARTLGVKESELMTDYEEEQKAETPEKRALAALLELDPAARERVLNALKMICEMGLDKPSR